MPLVFTESLALVTLFLVPVANCKFADRQDDELHEASRIFWVRSGTHQPAQACHPSVLRHALAAAASRPGRR